MPSGTIIDNRGLNSQSPAYDPRNNFKPYAESMGQAMQKIGELYIEGMTLVLPELGVARAAGAAVAGVKAAKEATTVIGWVKDLKNLQAGEQSLLERLPNLGSPKANWAQNSGVLREEMGRGLPIRDASPLDTTGQFLNAERNLFSDCGWTFDRLTNFWNPPKP